MSEVEKTETPAYVSFVTLTNTLDLLKADGVPPKFDRSLLPHMSGSAQSQIIVASRALGFIDQEGNTQQVMKDIVYANQQERVELWKQVLKDAYPFLFSPTDDFDLAICAPSTFRQKFSDQGISGATLNKAIRFFLQAAEFAKIEVSPHVKNANKTRRRTSKPKSQKSTRKTTTSPAPKSENGSTAPKPQQGQTQLAVAKGYEILQALLQKLPSDFEWTQNERDRWIMAHTAVLDLHVQVVEDDYDEDEDYG